LINTAVVGEPLAVQYDTWNGEQEHVNLEPSEAEDDT